jgi:hypothetical protein
MQTMFETNGQIAVRPWTDPVLDEIGYDPRSRYVERFWLPVLGPSTTWLLRHLAARLDTSPAGVLLDAAETSRALGLAPAGKRSPFARSLCRCVDFDMAKPLGPAALAVRRKLPPLGRRHLARLPRSLREEHGALLPAEMPAALAARLRGQGLQLAANLLDLGESPAAVEQQLVRWGLHPALARECTDGAASRGSVPAGQPQQGKAAEGTPPVGSVRHALPPVLPRPAG